MASGSLYDYYIFTDTSVADSNVTRGAINYSYTTPQPFAVYPDKSQISVFGPLYVPRVYGKDLSSLEIASSGKVAMTLEDVHSFDLSRDLATSNISLTTMSNDSFHINVNNNGAYINMDGRTNVVTIHSDNSINFDGAALGLETANTLNITSYSNNINMYAASNISVNAFNGSLIMTSSDSNMYTVFDHSTYNVTNYAASNIASTASNDWTVLAGNNISLDAQNGYMYLSASNDNAYVKLTTSNDAYLYALNNTRVTASNDLVLEAQDTTTITAVNSYVILSAANNHVSLKLNNDETMTLAASNNMIIGATSNLEMTSGSNLVLTAQTGKAELNAANNDMYLRMDANTLVTSMYGVGAITTTTLDTYTVGASGDMTVGTGSNMTITASNGGITLSASNNLMSITMDQATNDITVEAANDINLTSTKATAVSALAGNVTLDMTTDSNAVLYAARDITETASNNMTFTAWNDISMTACNNSIEMLADLGRESIVLDNTTHSITAASLCNVTVTAGKDFATTATSAVSIAASTGEFVTSALNSNVTFSMQNLTNGYTATLSATNEALVTTSNMVLTGWSNVTMKTDTSSINVNDDQQRITSSVPQTGTHEWYVGSTRVFYMDSNNIYLNGDLNVSGTIDSTNITQTNLYINDKTVTMSVGADGAAVSDGTANDRSGIRVNGDSPAYSSEKSLLWNYGDGLGMTGLGGADLSNESYWELKGGSFRLTHVKGASNEITFGFRISANDDLELVKRVVSSSNVTYKRIVNFGRTRL